MRRFLLSAVGLAAAVLVVAVTAGAKNPQPVGAEPVGSAEWPAVAAQLAKNIANDAFTHDLPRVWRYLLPAYQKAVPQSRWAACQHTHPVVPASIKIGKVLVASASEIPIDLSLVGQQNVQEIQLIVEYTDPPATKVLYAIVYTYWLKQGKAWSAVWPNAEFKAYKGGTCYVAPQGSAIY